MRAALALLLLLCLNLGAVRAGEETIPIEVEKSNGVEVTEAQLDHVRVWLREHLHPDDLAKIEIDVKNRAHPGADYRAEARLAPRDSGTHQVQRVIRFAHRTWPTWVLKEGDFDGDWAVEDRDRVQRIFNVDGTRKILPLDKTLSYEEVLAVLCVIARDGVRFQEDAWEEWRPNVRSVYGIRREDGLIEIRSGGPWRGTWIAGQLKDKTFVVEKQGGYMS